MPKRGRRARRGRPCRRRHARPHPGARRTAMSPPPVRRARRRSRGSSTRPPCSPANNRQKHVTASNSSGSTARLGRVARTCRARAAMSPRTRDRTARATGRWPSGDSPIVSQSAGAKPSTIWTSASVPFVNRSASSAFDTSRSAATWTSVPLDGSKCSSNVVGGSSVRAALNANIQYASTMTRWLTTSLTSQSVHRVAACHSASGNAAGRRASGSR